jgi:hypothetical protein
MKIAVISDTHIPDRANNIPKKVMEELKRADMVIHAGDLVDLSVLEQLKSSCNNIRGVFGNMDPPEVKAKLPEKDIITVGKYRIGVMHGYGAPGKLIELLSGAFKDDNVNIIIFGHSHSGVNERIAGILFFNPGSLTDKVFSPYNSYGIIEINDKIDAKIIRI